MKLLFFSLFLLSILVSCNNSKEIKKEEIVKIPDTSSVVEIVPNEEIVEEEIEFKNDFDILLPRSYRNWEGKNEANSLTKNWFDLYEKNGKYYLGKADFKLESGYDECVGDSTKIIESKNKTLLFIDFVRYSCFIPNLKHGAFLAVG